MKNILSDEIQRAALKKKLFQYPGNTEEKIEMLLSAYEERVETKEILIKDGFSNAMAEYYLDRKGYPRPPGWHSVFFYPDSKRLRKKYILLIVMTIIGYLLLF